MIKWNAFIVLSAGFLLASAAQAQSPSFFGGSVNSGSAPAVNRPLSPEEFKSQVNQLNTQTTNQVSQQVQSLLPPPKTPGMGNQPPPPPFEQPENTSTNISNQPPAPPGQQPGSQDNQYNQYNTGQQANPYPTASPNTVYPSGYQSNAPQQQQTNTYTGFGSGNTNNRNAPTTKPSGNSGGSWGIKY